MNDARYLTASHCLAFTVLFLNVSSYYVRIDLICERMLLLRSLSRLLLNSSSNDDSQQTLYFIRYLLSDFWNRSKILMKVSLLHSSFSFFLLSSFIFFFFCVVAVANKLIKHKKKIMIEKECFDRNFEFHDIKHFLHVFYFA